MSSDNAVLQLLKEPRVPHAPVLTVEEAIDHPHLRERGTVTTIDDRFIGFSRGASASCAYARSA